MAPLVLPFFVPAYWILYYQQQVLQQYKQIEEEKEE